MKPMFIPLKTEFYEMFESEEKNTEYRLYGPRWNEKICHVNREVIISKGYGKRNRMKGKITCFDKVHARMLGLSVMTAIEECYGYAALDKQIACITIGSLEPV